MTTLRWTWLLLVVGLLESRGSGAEVYVSPQGSPEARGTRDDPWDLASTLEGQRGVKPGDTVRLLKGTYRRRPQAEYSVKLVGTADGPIHVRPEPGARVTIDGGLSVEDPSAHVWVWDLEVLVSENLSMSRDLDEPGSHPESYGRPWGGVHLRGGKGCKLIHLAIHDCAQGVSAWSAAVGSEIYGCLIYENGWSAPDRGHGHAIYTQNEKGTKVIRHSILSAKYPGSYTMHAYGSSRAYVDHFLVDGNIAYGLGPFLIGGGRPSRGIRVLNNALHGVDLRLGYNAPHNEDCVVRDNAVVNGSLEISLFRTAVEEGNVVVPRGAVRSPDDALPLARLYPSLYRPGRAHLAVYGAADEDAASVRVAPWLSPGDRYRLYDPKGVFGEPVAQGVCRGDAISVPLCDGFAAYVVERSSAEGGATAAEDHYRGWSSWRLSHELLCLDVIPEIGGRVIQLRFGGEELFWVSPELAGNAPPPGGLGPDGSWLNYGGDKLWPAPQGWDDESQWPGPPDAVLDGGPYSIEVAPDDASILVRSAPDERSGIRLSRAIRVYPGSTRVSIDASMENVDTKPRRWGIWAHTQLDGGKADGSGHNPLLKAWCPLNPRSRFENGFRVIFGRKENPSFVADRERALMEVRYRYEVGKIGLDSPAGWVATVDGVAGQVFVQRFRYEPEREYPDGSSVEFWLNGKGTIHAYGREMVLPDSPPANPYVFESEILGPYASLAPGEVFTWHCDWFATTIGGDHPVVDCRDAGVTSVPFVAERRGGRVSLRGRFGVFAVGTLTAEALDEHGARLGRLPWTLDVDPRRAVVLDAEVDCPEGAARLSLVLQERRTGLPAELARARVATPASRRAADSTGRERVGGGSSPSTRWPSPSRSGSRRG